MTTFRLFLILIILTNSISCSSQVNAWDIKTFENSPYLEIARAVISEDTNVIRTLVQKDTTSLSYQDNKFGITLLNFAVIWNKVLSVKQLLELGANPNIRSLRDNGSAFLSACEDFRLLKNGKEILTELIDHGGDVNSVQKTWEYDHYYIGNPLTISCIYGNLESVKILIENGAETSIYPKNGENSLVVLALGNNLPVVKYFLLERQFPIPTYAVIRDSGTINERKLTVTDLLEESNFSSDDPTLKAEILKFIKDKGKR